MFGSSLCVEVCIHAVELSLALFKFRLGLFFGTATVSHDFNYNDSNGHEEHGLPHLGFDHQLHPTLSPEKQEKKQSDTKYAQAATWSFHYEAVSKQLLQLC